MAIRDNTSTQSVNLLFNAAIATDTDTNTFSIDTADHDFGVMFTMAVTDYTLGDITLALEESVDNSVWVDVPAEKLITTSAGVAIGAETDATAGDAMVRLGVFSNERFVRGVITSDNSADLTVIVAAVMAGEYNPQA